MFLNFGKLLLAGKLPEVLTGPIIIMESTLRSQNLPMPNVLLLNNKSTKMELTKIVDMLDDFYFILIIQETLCR